MLICARKWLALHVLNKLDNLPTPPPLSDFLSFSCGWRLNSIPGHLNKEIVTGVSLSQLPAEADRRNMAEAPCNTKLPSGFDEEFVYEVEDDFLCLICQLALKEPVLTRCGHRFCNACLEEHLRRYALATEFY